MLNSMLPVYLPIVHLPVHLTGNLPVLSSLILYSCKWEFYIHLTVWTKPYQPWGGYTLTRWTCFIQLPLPLQREESCWMWPPIKWISAVSRQHVEYNKTHILSHPLGPYLVKVSVCLGEDDDVSGESVDCDIPVWRMVHYVLHSVCS